MRPTPGVVARPFASSRFVPRCGSTAIPTHHRVWSRRSCFASSGLDQGFDLRAVEIRAHDPHALAIAPVELAVRLIEMELLRRERAAGCNDEPAVLAVEVGALDRAIVRAGNAHIGPVDVTGCDIDDDAVGMRAVGRDDLAI